MPTISISDEGKDFIEKIRKRIPQKKVPTQKDTIELIISFVKIHETEFLKWLERSES